jgi:general secretion pathway protein C
MSRAEIKQKAMNDLDNAMKGLVAGPYRRNGKLDGYILKTVNQENILYQLGLRSGDVVKRVNGKEVNSTERLYAMWQTLQNESKITADIERGGRMMTFDLNITD